MNKIMPQIEHIVYFMLENRSFDNLLGWLYEGDTVPSYIIANPEQKDLPFQGLKENTYYNFFHGEHERNYVQRGTGGSMTVPDPDPHEPYLDVSEQVFDQYFKKSPPDGATATMGGFLKNYASAYKGFAGLLCDQEGGLGEILRILGDAFPFVCERLSKKEALEILKTYTSAEVPVINGLARNYAVSDLWFSSVPTQTFANRAFSVCGTSCGAVDNHGSLMGLKPYRFDAPTIWNALTDNGYGSTQDWMVYYQDKQAWSWCFSQQAFNIPNHKDHVKHIDHFFDAVESGTLPAFSYLEPAWFAAHIFNNGNSYHPPSDLVPGEVFLKTLYDKLTANRDLWSKTLLIISFDEHGGTYDHVPPPWGAVPPWGNGDAPYKLEHGFHFNRFGVRVPTLMISPWIDAGGVLRSSTATPFDHTSLIASILKWKGIDPKGANLGERVASAPTFETVLTRAEPRTDVPQVELSPVLKALADKPPAAAEITPSAMQLKMLPNLLSHLAGGKRSELELLHDMAAVLHHVKTAEDLFTNIEKFRAKHAG